MNNTIFPNEIIKYIFEYMDRWHYVTDYTLNIPNNNKYIQINYLVYEYDGDWAFINGRWISKLSKHDYRYLLLNDLFYYNNENQSYVTHFCGPNWRRRGAYRIWNAIPINSDNNRTRYLHIQKVVNKIPYYGHLISYYTYSAYYNSYNDSSDTDIDDDVHDRFEYNE
jgi:hypothetical protein